MKKYIILILLFNHLMFASDKISITAEKGSVQKEIAIIREAEEFQEKLEWQNEMIDSFSNTIKKLGDKNAPQYQDLIDKYKLELILIKSLNIEKDNSLNLPDLIQEYEKKILELERIERNIEDSNQMIDDILSYL